MSDVLRLSWQDVVNWAADAASGVNHLHTEGFIHSDIAARNLLIDGENRIRGDLVIAVLFTTGRSLALVADFGMSSANKEQKQSVSLPLAWVAPELMNGSPPS